MWRGSTVLILALLVALPGLAATPRPVIGRVSPDEVRVAAGERFLRIEGSGFLGWDRTTVLFRGAIGEWRYRPNLFSPGEIEVWIPVEIAATPGQYSVVVTNDDGVAAPVESDRAYFEVTDRDGPLIYVPADMTVEASGPLGAEVTFHVESSGEPPICDHVSGELYRLGETVVRCTATDSSGATSEEEFSITVADTMPPVLTVPDDLTVQATGPDGAVVTFEATATDLVDGTDVSLVCSPASGMRLPIGLTEVHCSARDHRNNLASASFDVNVIESQVEARPVLTLPEEIVEEAANGAGAMVTYEASAHDELDGGIPVSCTPPSTSISPLGTTTVTCSATNSRKKTATGTFDVHVIDSTPPVFLGVTASPGLLQPLNHELREVTVTVETVDDVDPSPSAAIVGVMTNEPADASDWRITGRRTVELRAESSRPDADRIYTILVETIDRSGNRMRVAVDVTVSRDASDDGPPPAPRPVRRRAVGRS
jgi:hypothetical protein